MQLTLDIHITAIFIFFRKVMLIFILIFILIFVVVHCQGSFPEASAFPGPCQSSSLRDVPTSSARLANHHKITNISTSNGLAAATTNGVGACTPAAAAAVGS
jgi:hypothetical protein